MASVLALGNFASASPRLLRTLCEVLGLEQSSDVTAASEGEESSEGGLTTEELQAWFNETDIDEDGFISCDEFVEYVTCPEFMYMFAGKNESVTFDEFVVSVP